MAKSKKSKKKAKKNSNYKNEVIVKKVPQKSEKNQKELERKAKEKEKLKKKEEKALAKKQRAEEKLNKKQEKKDSASNKKAEAEAKKQEKSETKAKSKQTPIPEALPTEEVKEAVSEEAIENAVEESMEEIAEEIQPEEKPKMVIEEVIEEKTEEPESTAQPKAEEKTEDKKEIKAKKEIRLPQIKLANIDFIKAKLTKKNIIIAIVALVTVAALIAVLATIGVGGGVDYYPAIYSGRSFEGTDASSITISDEEQKQCVKDTNAKGNTGRFSFYANTEMAITEPNSALPVTIANPTTNDSILLCSIVNDDGVIVYRSLGIVPGKFVSTVRLSQYLDYGKNKLTLYVSAFGAEEGENGETVYDRIGTQKVKLEVVVGTDYISE